MRSKQPGSLREIEPAIPPIEERPGERADQERTAREDPSAAFARDVRSGLLADPKRLSCAYFYDPAGSLLFEEICAQPEYYPTRVETSILQREAAEILDRCPPDLTLVELGSGSSTKTRILIEELLRRNGRLRYVPIDISRSALERSSRELGRDYPGLEIDALAAEYTDGLHALAELASGPRLVLWLGSNVGNFDRVAAAAFLRAVGADLTPDDRALIGIDLRKDRRTLERAYDDARGATARFNLNLLARINRELGGRFVLERFRHRAVYDEEAGRIEMYLDSLAEQRVAIERLGIEVDFAEGEPIHTEDSYKYALREIDELARAAGFRVNGQWLDPAQWFSVNRFAPA